jgi:hypothetical protein
MGRRKRNSCSFEIERFLIRNGAKLKEAAEPTEERNW